MKKILVLFSGDIYQRRGFFNAVMSRTKHLKQLSNYDFDVLVLSEYEPWYIRKLRHSNIRKKVTEVDIDGQNVSVEWHNASLIDYVLSVRLHKSAVFKKLFLSSIPKRLKGYDFIISHSLDCGEIANRVRNLYGTPYSVTWHGSDIHSAPFYNPNVFRRTVSLIENANVNLFVSKNLKELSDRITVDGVKEVLYNGHHTNFYRYPENKRNMLRKRYGVEGKKVVVFVGNFFAVKNILKVPLIFKKIYNQYADVCFWMIGDGKYRKQVQQLSEGLPLRLWGDKSPEEIPDFLNVADVLILPSKNEGLPLTIVEALACGCNVVGSLVGGIPEVIGTENCVDPNANDFVELFADKVVFYLKASSRVEQTLADEFNWDMTAQKELRIIEDIL